MVLQILTAGLSLTTVYFLTIFIGGRCPTASYTLGGNSAQSSSAFYQLSGFRVGMVNLSTASVV